MCIRDRSRIRSFAACASGIQRKNQPSLRTRAGGITVGRCRAAVSTPRRTSRQLAGRRAARRAPEASRYAPRGVVRSRPSDLREQGLHLGDLAGLAGLDAAGQVGGRPVLACAFSVRAIAIAPWWCAIIMVRNSRSNADPVKPWSIPISASLIIPYGEVVPPMPGNGLPPIPDVDPIGSGVMPGTGLPPIPDVAPIGRTVMLGTAVGWPQLVSHPVMVVISGPWAARIRSAIVLTCPLEARVPARVAISMAY